MKKLPSLSVFYPCFNEAKNIPLFLAEALEVMPEVAQKFELIVVNDGSTDNTEEVVKQWERKHKNIKLVSHEENLGYGAALRTGIGAAQYDWIFFTDGDLQFRQNQIKKLVERVSESKVIIGRRANRAEGKLRAFNAWLFKIYIDVLFRLRVKDIDCAFKLFERELVQSIHLESVGAFTSAELLYKLKKKGVRFVQVPVEHQKRRHGSPTGNNPKVIIKAGIEALSLYIKIKIGSLAG